MPSNLEDRGLDLLDRLLAGSKRALDDRGATGGEPGGLAVLDSLINAGRIDVSTPKRDELSMTDVPENLARGAVGGSGRMLSGFGGALDMASTALTGSGSETGRALTAAGNKLAGEYGPSDDRLSAGMLDAGAREGYDPTFWLNYLAYQGGAQIPSMAMLSIPGGAMARGAGAVFTAGRMATWAPRIAGIGTTAALNAAQQAGDVFNQAKAAGKTDEEAINEGVQVGLGVMATNVVIGGVTMWIPNRASIGDVAKKLADSGRHKMAGAVLRSAGVAEKGLAGLGEGIEEVFEGGITRRVQGGDFFDRASFDEFVLGTVAGVGAETVLHTKLGGDAKKFMSRRVQQLKGAANALEAIRSRVGQYPTTPQERELEVLLRETLRGFAKGLTLGEVAQNIDGLEYDSELLENRIDSATTDEILAVYKAIKPNVFIDMYEGSVSPEEALTPYLPKALPVSNADETLRLMTEAQHPSVEIEPEKFRDPAREPTAKTIETGPVNFISPEAREAIIERMGEETDAALARSRWIVSLEDGSIAIMGDDYTSVEVLFTPDGQPTTELTPRDITGESVNIITDFNELMDPNSKISRNVIPPETPIQAAGDTQAPNAGVNSQTVPIVEPAVVPDDDNVVQFQPEFAVENLSEMSKKDLRRLEKRLSALHNELSDAGEHVKAQYVFEKMKDVQAVLKGDPVTPAPDQAQAPDVVGAPNLTVVSSPKPKRHPNPPPATLEEMLESQAKFNRAINLHNFHEAGFELVKGGDPSANDAERVEHEKRLQLQIEKELGIGTDAESELPPLGTHGRRVLTDLTESFGLSPDEVEFMDGFLRAIARTWGEANGVDPDGWFTGLTVVNENTVAGTVNGKPAKAGIKFVAEDGRAIITAFSGSDVSAAIHEVAHRVRRYLPDEDLRALEVEYKVAPGTEWHTEGEEEFARDTVSYFMGDSTPPTPELARAFERIRTILRRLWLQVRARWKEKTTDAAWGTWDRVMTGEGTLNPNQVVKTGPKDTLAGKARFMVPSPDASDIREMALENSRDGDRRDVRMIVALNPETGAPIDVIASWDSDLTHQEMAESLGLGYDRAAWSGFYIERGSENRGDINAYKIIGDFPISMPREWIKFFGDFGLKIDRSGNVAGLKPPTAKSEIGQFRSRDDLFDAEPEPLTDAQKSKLDTYFKLVRQVHTDPSGKLRLAVKSLDAQIRAEGVTAEQVHSYSLELHRNQRDELGDPVDEIIPIEHVRDVRHRLSRESIRIVIDRSGQILSGSAGSYIHRDLAMAGGYKQADVVKAFLYENAEGKPSAALAEDSSGWRMVADGSDWWTNWTEKLGVEKGSMTDYRATLAARGQNSFGIQPDLGVQDQLDFKDELGDVDPPKSAKDLIPVEHSRDVAKHLRTKGSLRANINKSDGSSIAADDMRMIHMDIAGWSGVDRAGESGYWRAFFYEDENGNPAVTQVDPRDTIGNFSRASSQELSDWADSHGFEHGTYEGYKNRKLDIVGDFGVAPRKPLSGEQVDVLANEDVDPEWAPDYHRTEPEYDPLGFKPGYKSEDLNQLVADDARKRKLQRDLEKGRVADISNNPEAREWFNRYGKADEGDPETQKFRNELSAWWAKGGAALENLRDLDSFEEYLLDSGGVDHYPNSLSASKRAHTGRGIDGLVDVYSDVFARAYNMSTGKTYKAVWSNGNKSKSFETKAEAQKFALSKQDGRVLVDGTRTSTLEHIALYDKYLEMQTVLNREKVLQHRFPGTDITRFNPTRPNPANPSDPTDRIPITSAEARQTLAEITKEVGPKAMKNFKRAEKSINRFWAALLDHMKDSGLLSEEDYANIKNQNDYAPYLGPFSVIEHNFDLERSGQGGGDNSVYNARVLETMKGTNKDIMPISIASFTRISKVLRAAEKNKVLQNLVRMRWYSKEAKDLIIPLKPTFDIRKTLVGYDAKGQPRYENVNHDMGFEEAPAGYTQIGVWEAGKMARYAVPAEVAASLGGLDSSQADIVQKAFRKFVNVSRFVNTTSSPTFFFRNLPRDYFTQFLRADHPFGPWNAKDMYDLVHSFATSSGLLKSKKARRVYRAYLKSGAAFSGRTSMFRPSQGRAEYLEGGISIDDVVEHPENVWKFMTRPWNAAERVLQAGEEAPRQTAFRKTLRLIRKDQTRASIEELNAIPDDETITITVSEGGHRVNKTVNRKKHEAARLKAREGTPILSDMDALIEAAYAARENTVDFRGGGDWLVRSTAYVPFVKARGKSFYTVMEGVKKHPARAAGATVILTLMSVAIRHAAHEREKHGFLAGEIPDQIRDDNWIYVTDQFVNLEGKLKPVYYKLPKAEWVKPFARFAEGLVDALHGEGDTDLWADVLDSVGLAFPWVDQWGGETNTKKAKRFSQQFIPPPLKAVMEHLSNENWYTGMNLIPGNRVDLTNNPELQGSPYATQTARKIAEWSGVPSAVVDNYIRGLTGDLGYLALQQVPEWIVGPPEERKELTTEERISNYPVLRAFYGTATGKEERRVHQIVNSFLTDTYTRDFLDKEAVKIAARDWTKWSTTARDKFRGEYLVSEELRQAFQQTRELLGQGVPMTRQSLLSRIRGTDVDSGDRARLLAELFNRVWRHHDDRITVIGQLSKMKLYDDRVAAQMSVHYNLGHIDPPLEEK